MNRLGIIVIELGLMFAFFSINSFGQDKKDIENFINQIAIQIVPQEFEYYNLVDSSIITYPSLFNRVKNEIIRDGYLKKNEDLIYQLNTLENDSLVVNWNDYVLLHAHIYSENKLPNKYLVSSVKSHRITTFTSNNNAKRISDSLNSNELLVSIKHWQIKKHFKSRKYLSKMIKEKWNEYENLLNKEDRDFYQFSVPIFSENKKYAIVSIRAQANGYTYLFKKNDNEWEVVYKTLIIRGFIDQIRKK